MEPTTFYLLCALVLAIKIVIVVFIIRERRENKRNRTSLRVIEKELMRSKAVGGDPLVLSVEIKKNKRGRSQIELVDANGSCVLRSPESHPSDKKAMQRVLSIANSNIREMLDGATLVFEGRISMPDPPPMPVQGAAGGSGSLGPMPPG